jgi:hypothetical protein
VSAFFRHSLILTYALPRDVLQPLLPPGLVLDTLGDFGFLAIALVQTKDLRPRGLPRILGQDFFLSGYRIFARFTTAAGRTLRGLRILRSDTDSRLMMRFGNLLTHYGYRLATVDVIESAARLEIIIGTPQAEADLHVIARIDSPAPQLPAESPFSDFHEARLYAGPLPFTFDYERETNSIVMIEGVRQRWQPRPVSVQILKNSFLEHSPFREAHPRLANAFYVRDIEYGWKRGTREPLRPESET